MRIRRHRLTERAARQLVRHRLNIGDVALVLRLGRRRLRGNVEQFFVDSRCLPEGCEERLKRLCGVTVIVEGEQITNVHRRPLRKTTNDEVKENDG